MATIANDALVLMAARVVLEHAMREEKFTLSLKPNGIEYGIELSKSPVLDEEPRKRGPYKKKHWTQTAKGRAYMSKLAKKKTGKPHWTQTPEGREKMSAAQKKRYAVEKQKGATA